LRLQWLVWTLCLTTAAAAEIQLPHVLSDHAVLQREQPVRIWGWSAGAENVTVKFHNQTVATQADVWGAWQAWLMPEKPGGPYTLSVAGDASAAPVLRTDILVGDVWFAAGQSNMEFPLQGYGSASPLKDQEKEIAAANHPNIRLLRQGTATGAFALADTDYVWTTCTPETAKSFSAVAYFFGRRISEEEKVPIGLIDSTWGGTPVQSWISADGIAWAGLTSIDVEAANVARESGAAAAIKSRFAAEDAAAKAAGKPAAQHAKVLGDHPNYIPGSIYNGMIAPYTNYTIKGVLWYQGETDHEWPNRYLTYSRVFPSMIQDWRKHWGEGNIPFLFAQISSYGSGPGWGNIRDAQRRSLEVANTGMAVTLDVGLEKNIHPPDKQTVSDRLAQAALGLVYARKVETSGPLFEQATTEGKSIRVWFSHAEGLKCADAEIGDFEVAGDDHRFVPATAKIQKVGGQETVLATAGGIAAPVYVRYGWQGTVRSFLYNGSGMPISTFTSESDEWLLLH